MDYSLMICGALGLAFIVVIGGVVVWRKKKKKATPEEIYPMW